MTDAQPPGIKGIDRLEFVGQGGYGTVWRGRQRRPTRDVAVKVLTGRTKAGRRAFETEIKALRQLAGHPHVVRVYGTGTTRGGDPYLLMEYCPQRSYGAILTDRVVHGRALFSATEVAEVGRKVADALATAHGLGIVHGDVSPDNVLRSAAGEPVLADFGQAVRAADRQREVGVNFSHVAPEVLRTGRAEPPSDVYGLGSTLYTLLTGQPPFPQRPGEDPIRQQQRIHHDDPAPLPASYVPAPLAELVAAMLHKDPQLRPDTARVRDLLGEPFDDLEAMPSTHTRTVLHPGSVADVDDEEAADGQERERERRWPVAVGMVAGLAIAAMLVTLLIRTTAPTPVADPATDPTAPSTSPAAVPTTPQPTGAFRLTVRDNGTTAELAWTAYDGADYYLPGRLRLTPRRQPDTLPLVRAPRTTTLVAIDARAKYCFQIAAVGRAGGDPPRSNVVGIRGATCPAEV